MEVHVSFRGRKPVPQHVDIGMERENKVTVLCFGELPKMDGSTAYLHIDLGNNSDAIEIIDGQADVTRTITQFTGGVEAFVEVLGANDRVWHSQIMELFVGRLPILGEKIEQEYPTAFEQALAQTAADKAAAAKSAADAAATAAGIVTEEAARKDAESKRVEAEAARETAEEKREQAEAAREQEMAEALASVAGVENAVRANEQQRVLAERTRAAQEQARQSAEQSRVEAEQARAQAEQRRDTAETVRAEAERQRVSTETSRQTAETTRNAAENGRAKAEKTRETAESQRQQAETARADAEGKRVQAEQGRVTAEQGRVEAEAQREEAMAQHAEKIAELEAEVAKKAKIDDTTVSGTEAWSSQHIVDMLCPPLEEGGNPVVCYPVAGSKLSVTASWEPEQEGEGTPSPDNIRPIHGRTQVKVERCGENLVNTQELNNIGWATRYQELTDELNKLPIGVYALRCMMTIDSFSDKFTSNTAIASAFILRVYAKNGKPIITTPVSQVTKQTPLPLTKALTAVFSIAEENVGKIERCYCYSCGRDTAVEGAPNGQLGTGRIYDVCIVSSSTAPDTYSPYVGSTTTLTLPSTIYGGEIDADGAGQETWGYIESYAGEAVPAGWICDRAVYADGATPPTGAQVAYKLATPVPFTASGGGTVKALSGTNTILTDADILTVTGRADPIRIIQQLQAASAASAQALADEERAVTDI